MARRDVSVLTRGEAAGGDLVEVEADFQKYAATHDADAIKILRAKARKVKA
jgi:hypothetical protein